MKKLSIHLPKLHITLTRLTSMATWALLILSLLVAVLLAWFSLSYWYSPLNDTTIPEEKLNQKREQIRVKDFDEARTKLEAKQKTPTESTENPFQ